MKFRKNVVALGSSRVASARECDGCLQFFMAGEGVVIRKVYDPATRSLKTDADSVSFASGYLKLKNTAVEDLGVLKVC